MRIQENLKSFLLLFVAMMLVSCATAPEKNKMIPYIDYSTFASSGLTLKIKEVKGGEITEWDIPKIDGKDFKGALIDTLNKAGIFKEVYTDTDHAGDYELFTGIVSQKIVPGLTTYAALLVNYRLIETITNQTIWSENIFSQNVSFASKQGKDAIEAAARDNLAQLTRKLAAIQYQLNKK